MKEDTIRRQDLHPAFKNIEYFYNCDIIIIK